MAAKSVLEFTRSYLNVSMSDEAALMDAAESSADCVVLDLEDTVVSKNKVEARARLVSVLSDGFPKPVIVRVNPVGTEDFLEDASALKGFSEVVVRLPKTSSADSVLVADKAFGGRKYLHCLVESAEGLVNAPSIARASRNVCGVMGSRADLAADLGVADELALEPYLQQVLVAARSAGLPFPPLSVYLDISDPTGLLESTQRGQRMGFFGRSATHVDQVEVINSVFTPTTVDFQKAMSLLSKFQEAERQGIGKMFVDGKLVDEATVRGARRTCALAEQFGVAAA